MSTGDGRRTLEKFLKGRGDLRSPRLPFESEKAEAFSLLNVAREETVEREGDDLLDRIDRIQVVTDGQHVA